MKVLRTPEERFEDLPQFDYDPHYVEIAGIRLHYLDEGPDDASVVLLLHGEPTWSYLYRKMIPVFVEAGYRVIAPDYVGFGRSDKLKRKQDHSYQFHVEVMTTFVRNLDLKDITLFAQDWGGLIGLRVLANEQERFSRVVISNTGFPATRSLLKQLLVPKLFKMRVWLKGRISEEEFSKNPSFLNWVAYSQTVKEFPIGKIIQGGTVTDLPSDVLRAYEAPFPDESYMAGPRVMPMLVPTQLRENQKVWEAVLKKWEKPFLTTFSDGDPITRGGERIFQKLIPGARGQEHVIIKKAGHFLQEDKAEEIAIIIVKFIED